MIGAIANHLWQSTAFAGAVALLAYMLRHNQARVRYALWFTASVKFFIPFALFMSLGGWFESAPGTLSPASRAVAAAVVQISEPFDPIAVNDWLPATSAASVDWLGWALLAAWASGFCAIAWGRMRAWRQVRAAVRASTPLVLHRGFAPSTLEIRSTPCLLEPGVIGLRRPVLLLPVDLVEHLTPSQLEAVLTHELCHVRRRDNATAAIHMLAEALFWFHPLVWWIGARLVQERERACDEHVLDVVAEPRVYAEGILTVCKRYVESPHPCMSGVSGADLRKRIEAIMFNRVGGELSIARKTALALAASAALVVPLVAGMMGASLRAQAQERFEVASVKPCDAESPPPPVRSGARQASGNGTMTFSPGMLTIRCATVERLMQIAHSEPGRQLTPQIKEGPAWTRSERFTIVAKAEGTPDRGVMTGPMLRALLQDRFQLKMHEQIEDGPIYAMTVAKGGLKIRPNREGDCLRRDQAPPVPATREEQLARLEAVRTGGTPICGQLTMLQNLLIFGGTTFANVAQFLSSRLDRPVIDKTGINDIFNVRLEYARDGEAAGANVRAISPTSEPAEVSAPSIFVALEQQLGVKLEATKGPRQLFVIDRIERPTPN